MGVTIFTMLEQLRHVNLCHTATEVSDRRSRAAGLASLQAEELQLNVLGCRWLGRWISSEWSRAGPRVGRLWRLPWVPVIWTTGKVARSRQARTSGQVVFGAWPGPAPPRLPSAVIQSQVVPGWPIEASTSTGPTGDQRGQGTASQAEEAAKECELKAETLGSSRGVSCRDGRSDSVQ